MATLARTRPERQPWIWMTVPLALLLLVAGLGSIFTPDLYRRDAAILAVQVLSQDYFSLVVVIPMLAGCAWLVRRGSLRAWLVWLGALFYLVYTYLVYAFAVQFNALFPVYVALLGCSVYGLLAALMGVDADTIKVRFDARTPVRVFSGVLGLTALLFYGLALSEVLPAVFSGTIPPTVTELNLPVDYTHVGDMAIGLPATALAAVLLWQRRPFGYVLAGMVLSLYAFMMSYLTVTLVIMAGRGFAIDGGEFAMIAGIALLQAGLTVWYLGRLKA